MLCGSLVLMVEGQPNGDAGPGGLGGVANYKEFFYRYMLPWVHYVPVAENLGDLAERLAWADAHPTRVAQIAAAATQLTTHLHAYEIACFWWQLLTALAPLQDFMPRSDQQRLGFVPVIS